MRKETPLGMIALQVVGGTIALLIIGATLSLLADALPGEQLTAIAGILGGLIGAGGTALAVYLTLASQRSDEAERVEGALRIEVAEHARLAYGQLGVCELILFDGYEVPVRDLPTLMVLPEAPIYKAVADRVSRLPYGRLFVVFHTRIAEAQQMARICAAATRPPILSGRAGDEEVVELMQSRQLVNHKDAKTLATAWFDACMIARTILQAEASASELADAATAEVLADLEAARTGRVGAMLEKEKPTPQT
jgi:hypothetical protein